jgi:radical SAM protein with 4Fe4S-binding SPASM domain
VRDIPQVLPVAGEPDPTAAAPPRRLQVEVTGACNLQCRMCLVRYRPKLDRQDAAFPLDRYLALLDALPELEQVTLQGLGEPLLHPDLVAMVRAAKERGIRVGFNTNGTVLTVAKAEALVDAGLDWLHVSVDGATPRTFEHIRDGARFHQVVRNLRRLVAVRERSGRRTPTIQLNTVVMRTNLDELDDLVRLAVDVGVDRMWFQALSHDFSDTAAEPCGCAGADGGGEADGAAGDAPDPATQTAYVEIRRYTESEAIWADHGQVPEALERARRLATELGLELRLPDDGAPPEDGGVVPGAEPALPCDWPWSGVYVTHAGKVQPCCMVMGEDRAVLGDLSASSFDQVWNGRDYRDFRAALLSDRPPAVCRGCSWYRRVF